MSLRHDDTSRTHELLAAVARLPDGELIARLTDVAQCSRRVTVEMLAHLAELDRRRLHRSEGCGKLFPYCTQVLKLSEAAAWNRIKAARAARRCPVILEMLAAGDVNLTTVRLLSSHLTAANHTSLLGEVRGLTRRQVDKIVARLSPQPDARSLVRKVPAAARVVGSAACPAAGPAADDRSAATSVPAAPTVAAAGDVGRALSPAPAPGPRAVVAPLAPARYRVQVTVGEEAHDDLRYLQDMLRREIPDGDPAEIVSRALRLLRSAVDKKAFRATSRPQPGRRVKAGSRHVPADVQRAVWERDGGQCAFVARNGRRCTEQSDLHYHHCDPYALGGPATVDNISLRCRDHNDYEAELVFGKFDVARARAIRASAAGRRVGRTGPGTSRAAPSHAPP
jgi:hypothetical protein